MFCFVLGAVTNSAIDLIKLFTIHGKKLISMVFLLIIAFLGDHAEHMGFNLHLFLVVCLASLECSTTTVVGRALEEGASAGWPRHVGSSLEGQFLIRLIH
jgi:hypothetical protein